MQDWWIYHHFINTIWFLLFFLSIPSILGLWILYYYLKNVHQEGSQGQQSNQNNQNNQQADNLDQNSQQSQNQENQNSQQVQGQPT